MRLQRLVEAYEKHLVRYADNQLPESVQHRIRKSLRSDIADIQRALQRQKVYDRVSLRNYCVEALLQTDNNGDGQADYSREQASLVMDGILGFAGIP
jgi:hypothetical protein